MKFVICTRDFSGLGFGLRLQDEGHEVTMAREPGDKEKEDPESYELVGEGVIRVDEMSGMFGARSKLRDAYWIFDSNYLYEYADKLRKEGFKVFGSSDWTSKMEHERDYGTQIAKSSGLDLPETKQFSDAQEAITFLESNPEKAYVCKPDEAESHLTYVPQMEVAKDANTELRSYLLSMDDGSDFILQEKIKGVEINVECFFYKGKPYFAWANFECKRKNSGDKGELTGCSQDMSFIVPMDCPLVKNTVGKMFPTYSIKMNYTGFGDMNVVLSDNKVYFIEWCLRFGYNAHANLFWNLCLSPLAEVFAAMIDGKTENFYRHFRKGFGASIQMYLDHPTSGFPLYISPAVKDQFYVYDICQDDRVVHPETDFFLSGYSSEIGIINGFGYTMKDAAKAALDNALKVNFPICAYREDLNEVDYPSSPIKRYEAICAMDIL